MANIQVTHDTDPNHARSESNIAINPNNTLQIVSGSKKFNHIQTYDFVLATQYSADGGHSWHDSADLPLPGFTLLTDPALAWDDAGNVFLVGLSGNNPPTFNTIGIEIYKSSDGGKTWSNPKRIHASPGDDKQWAAGDSNPASPFHGNVYAVWDDGSDMRFARTKDHGATWVGAGPGNPPAGTVITAGSFAPEINVAENGTIYIFWIDGNEIKMIYSTDGGDSFNPGVSPATGVVTLGGLGPHFPGATFRVLTIPTAGVFGSMIAVAWADTREGVSRVYCALSLNGGASWVTGTSGRALLSGPLPANMNHFHPQIVIDPNGVIGCAFYEFGPKPTTPKIDVIFAQSFDGGNTFDHFTVTDQPWDPAVDAPWSHGSSSVTFIGDYFGLDASDRGFYPLWTDTRTGIQELFTAIVPEKKCAFIINRSTLGQDEVDARRHLPGGPVIPDALRVVVDGFTASEIGAFDSTANLPLTWPAAGVSVVPRGNVSSNGDYGPEVQRFTFIYDLNFGPTDTAFNFAGTTEFLTLNVTAGPASAQAQIELIKQPDPFLLHGDVYWLSVDMRVFTARAGQSMFGVPGISSAADAPRFIKQLMTTITPAQFDSLSPDEDHSKLYVQPTDENNAPVFNFALAKVHYIGLIGAHKVRVFFRLFNAQSTNGSFDFPPGTKYRRAPSNAHGQPIPLAGIAGSEYTTIPCFADARIDTTLHSMAEQTDDANVRDITAHSNGSEVDTIFGCWLDINQLVNRLPAQAAGQVDGPFTNPGNPPVPIQQSILRNLHQCLIAEIAFDPIAIPPGKDPSNWDKLAQRNLAWADVGSAPALSTFEIRPTPADLPADQPPDELMIDWGSMPSGSTATIYLPAVQAEDILAMAAKLYTAHHLERADAHTLRVKTGGITYIPIPPGADIDYTGLLTIDLPQHLERERMHTIVVRQVTNAYSSIIFSKPNPGRGGRRAGREAAANENPAADQQAGLAWRRVLGAFQLNIPVKPHNQLLLPEERDLSVLLWIGEAIPHNSRWRLVFQRYLEGIKDRVWAFGGDPGQIGPSPAGNGKGEPPPHKPPEGEERRGYTGKISALIFDRFGDFEGFILDTEDGGAENGEHKFFSREQDMADLAERVWRERLRLTVWVEKDEPHRPLNIIIHQPPATFQP